MSYQKCTNKHAVSDGIYEVESDSNASKTYKVDMGQTPPTCTCTAYAIGRNRAKSNKPVKTYGPQQAWCKHIERVYDIHCSFDSRIHGESMIPVCPLCGSGLKIKDDKKTKKPVVPVMNEKVLDAATEAKQTPEAPATTEATIVAGSLLDKLGQKLATGDSARIAELEGTVDRLKGALRAAGLSAALVETIAAGERAEAEHVVSES